MKRVIKSGIVMIILVGLVSNSNADEWQTVTPVDPWYFGLGIGKTVIAVNKPSLVSGFSSIATPSSTFNHDDLAFNIYSGYKLDKLLSLEFGLSELGSAIATTNGAASKLFNIYTLFFNTTARHRYNKNAIFFGKIGAHSWSLGSSLNTTHATGTDLLLGAGIELNLFKNINRKIRIEWSHYFFDKVYIDSVDALTINLIFNYAP